MLIWVKHNFMRLFVRFHVFWECIGYNKLRILRCCSTSPWWSDLSKIVDPCIAKLDLRLWEKTLIKKTKNIVPSMVTCVDCKQEEYSLFSLGFFFFFIFWGLTYYVNRGYKYNIKKLSTLPSIGAASLHLPPTSIYILIISSHFSIV